MDTKASTLAREEARTKRRGLPSLPPGFLAADEPRRFIETLDRCTILGSSSSRDWIVVA